MRLELQTPGWCVFFELGPDFLELRPTFVRRGAWCVSRGESYLDDCEFENDGPLLSTNTSGVQTAAQLYRFLTLKLYCVRT